MKTKIVLECNGSSDICKIRNASLYAILQDVATCEDLVGNCPNSFCLNITIKRTEPKKDMIGQDVYVTLVTIGVTFGSVAPKGVDFGVVYQDEMVVGYVHVESMSPLTVEDILNDILQPS